MNVNEALEPVADAPPSARPEPRGTARAAPQVATPESEPATQGVGIDPGWWLPPAEASGIEAQDDTPAPEPAPGTLVECLDDASPPVRIEINPAEPPPLREPHDDLVASLGRRFRGATLKLDFELRTTVARQVFRRDFVYISQQLHALEASRRVQGIDRPRLKEALATVARCIDAVRALLLRCAADARALILLHGHAGADVEFARPTRLRATIVSPYARDFVDILGHADEALTQLERAWLLGLLHPAAKAQQASECRRALQGFKEIVRQQRHAIGAHVREVNAGRRLAATGDESQGLHAIDPSVDPHADMEGDIGSETVDADQVGTGQ